MYIDLIFIINFVFDFLLLLSVSLILRRNTKMKRIVLGSFLGTIMCFLLLVEINIFLLVIIKLIISLIIILITFGYKDIKYYLDNVLYFYLNSVVLGGCLYLLKIELIKYVDFDFINIFDYGIMFIILILFGPFILFLYCKKIKQLKNYYSLNYKVTLFLNEKKLLLNAFLDTGNMLIEPYKKRGVIITYNNYVKEYILNSKYFLVPYDTIDSHGILKCISLDKIFIKGVGYRRNVVIGYINDSFKMNGIDLILNKKVMEGRNV